MSADFYPIMNKVQRISLSIIENSDLLEIKMRTISEIL